MNKIIKIFDNESETLRILEQSTKLIDKASVNIKKQAKYSAMDSNQIAALTAFEEELKKIYMNEKGSYKYY